VPETFARDLARGGGGFRAAFPQLVRRVVKIAASPGRICVRVVCLGEHVGPFFELLTPTGRWVGFHVDHHFAVVAEHVVDDCIAMNLRALVVQLANAVTSAPGPTSRSSSIHQPTERFAE
jgi:predicted ester cyclase